MLFLRSLSKFGFCCLGAHSVSGILIGLIIVWMEANEGSGFNCIGRSEEARRWCYLQYKMSYESPLPYGYFILINFSSVYVVILIFAAFSFCCQWYDGKIASKVYLALQLLFGALFTFLQHGVFFPKWFEYQFNCTFPSKEPQFKLPYTYATCENLIAENKDVVMVLVSIVNLVVAIMSLRELIRLLRHENFQILRQMWSRDPDDNVFCHCFKSTGKNIRWMQKSLRHRQCLELLVEKIRNNSTSVRKIGVYYVCFEDRFRIGNGSIGTEVFVGLGTDGVEVAVKRLDLKFVDFAENEFEMLNVTKLSESPHVLDYRYYYEDRKKGFIYLVLDLQEENLGEHVSSTERCLLQHEGPTMLKQVLKGLNTLHDENILHRDLNPKNILVNRYGRMILADFGLCRRLRIQESTHESIMRGMEGWVAVESLPNDHDKNLLSYEEIKVRYKKESDVQVLGMLFYFVLTKGKHPFGTLVDFDRLTNIKRGVFNLSDLVDPVSKDLIDWMIQQDFTKRPTVKECLKHPYLVTPERNFGLLKAVGNELEIKTKDGSSFVVREINGEYSLITPSWKSKIDGEVYNFLCHSRNYTDHVADLLRFIRNVGEHWGDAPRPPSVQQKDVQVPVCPLCNKPVPVNRGEPPDIKVGEHIDRDCESDPAKEKRKLNANKCSAKGCKKKELIPVLCDSCRRNYCLRHRHPQDHDCATARKANYLKAQNVKNKPRDAQVNQAKKTPQQTSLSALGKDLDRARRERSNQSNAAPRPVQQPTRSHQSGTQQPLSEDEALALAIQVSLAESSSADAKLASPNKPETSQEEQDRALAQAIADSEREARNSRQRQQTNQKRDEKSCTVS